MEVLMSIVILRWVTDVTMVRSMMYDMILDAIKRVSISAICQHDLHQFYVFENFTFGCSVEGVF